MPEGVEPVDKVAWLRANGAHGHIDCLNWTEFPYRPSVKFAAAYTPTHLTVWFCTDSSFVKAENSANQSAVSSDSCVEVFIRPYAGGEYWNFEFNCIGAVNASHRVERPAAVRLSDDDLETIVRRADFPPVPFAERPAVRPWTLLVEIPFALMGVDPVPGTVLEANFYACAGAASKPYYLSWNAIDAPRPNFHLPGFFGRIVLG